jgi:uncharacterized alpha-E superfamily protein
MLSRVAEDVFWMSRYVERAVAVARLIDVTLHLELDVGDADEHTALWAPLLGPGAADTVAAGGAGESVDGSGARPAPSDPVPTESALPAPRDIRHLLAFDADNRDSLVSCIRRARTAARGVRECISSEMWEQLNTLYLSLVDAARLAEAQDAPHTFFRRVREGAQFFHGLADCTLAHDEPWHFVSLGKYLERADCVARMLHRQAHLLTPANGGREDPTVRWLAVLRSCGSAEAYARYYSLRVEPARVVEFLLLNPVFPQSVRFSLSAAQDALDTLVGSGAGGGGPGATYGGATGPEVRALGLLRARVEHAAVDEVMEEGLDAFLADVRGRIAAVSDHITRSFLRDEPQLGRLVGVARAAMIMAAQQQQQQ